MKDPYTNRKSLSYRFRQERFRHVEGIIRRILDKKGSCKIVDLGGTEVYWDIGMDFISKHNVDIDLLNSSKSTTTTDLFNHIEGDARSVGGISDNTYDLCHSNSVIEHVGKWEDMVSMAGEISRLAPNYFVQVPYFWFPLEPHFRAPFFHWLPEQIRCRLLMKKRLGFHEKKNDIGQAMMSIQSASLLDRAQFSYLFPDGKIIPEKIMFMTKSLMAIRVEEN